MTYDTLYSEAMAKPKRIGVQFDVEMLKMADDIADSTGIPRTEVLRRALLFMKRLNGVEVREMLGVNASEIKRPDIVEMLWRQLRGQAESAPASNQDAQAQSKSRDFRVPRKGAGGRKQELPPAPPKTGTDSR